MPRAYARRMPQASKDFIWQFVFPSSTLFHDAKTKLNGRWHIHISSLQKAIQGAARQADIRKHASVHTLRHSFDADLLRSDWEVRRIQGLLGHTPIETTMVYGHIVDAHQLTVVSPLDTHSMAGQRWIRLKPSKT